MSGTVFKKKVRPGRIEADPRQLCVLVHYTEEKHEMSTLGESLRVLEQKPGVKRIRVPKLDASSDVPALAREVVAACKYLTEKKTPKVEDALMELLQRELSGGSGGADADAAELQMLHERHAGMGEGASFGGEGMAAGDAASELPANVHDLDEYLEALYDDDIKVKARATGQIAQLARRTEHLEELISSENLLAALTRVVREDGKRSMDLTINVISVFFAFSNFSQFHEIIIQNSVGDLTMRAIDLEMRRIEHRKSPDIQKQLRKAAGADFARLDEATQKLVVSVRKQDKLLYLCFYLLLNLAEDVNIERRMKKRDIVGLLCTTLREKRNVELLILVVMFLKKLSIYDVNKERMRECDIAEALSRLLPCTHEVLLTCLLRLVLNLSFDPEIRAKMADAGMVPKVVELVKAPFVRDLALGVLYHLSMDDKCKSMFTYTDCVLWVREELVNNPDETTSQPELIALAVNLTQNQRNAEVFCGEGGLDSVFRRAVETRDSLLFKVLRNISQMDGSIKQLFAGYMSELAELMKAPDTHQDLLVEIVGVLSNLTIEGFNFSAFIRQHDLLPFLGSYLQPGVVEDDIVLEVVMFAGTLCTVETAEALVRSGMVSKLYDLIAEKKDDDEIVLQITYAFKRLMLCRPTFEALMEHEQVIFYLVDLLKDKNEAVRKQADACLDIVQDSSEVWRERVRAEKFRSYNHEWLMAVEADDMNGGVGVDGGGMEGYGALDGQPLGDHEDAIDAGEWDGLPEEHDDYGDAGAPLGGDLGDEQYEDDFQ